MRFLRKMLRKKLAIFSMIYPSEVASMAHAIAVETRSQLAISF
jgi:hypothetical protein